MKFYDVIIVGAGPGGLACARKLGNAGKKVLLLEKNKVIGPKVCAGGLTGKGLEYFKIPEGLLDFKFDMVNVFTPLQKRFINTDKAFIHTIDRKKLGQWQLKKIKKKNVIIRTSSMVTKITGSYIVVNDSRKIGYKYLVGADGSNSSVRAHLGLKVRDFLIAIQYIVPKTIYDKFEFFFDSKLFGAGYAWIFPHKKYVSIGCGCDPRIMPIKKIREGFDIWLRENNIDVSKGIFEASPINYDYQGHKFNNIFLVGDAAGLASGLTGEGIYQALVSGEEVAKLIIDENYV
jgi:geranylgeranyl reductase